MYISEVSQLKPGFRALYNQAEIMLASGKKIIVEVSEKKNKRSLEQNNYLWLFNSELAKFLDDAGLAYGEFKLPYTAELIHDINKRLFGVKSTAKMSRKDFCEYMNKLLLFWQQRTNGEFSLSELPANYLERKGYIL